MMIASTSRSGTDLNTSLRQVDFHSKILAREDVRVVGLSECVL